MLRKIKSRIVRAAGPIGGYPIAKYLTRSMPKVMMYHRFSKTEETGKVSVNSFEQQMALLHKEFHVINLTQLCNLIINNKSIPVNSIVLTIDDGYDDFYQYAYPILKKYNFPATLYITTDFIDQKIWLWPDSIRYILLTTHKHNCNINNSVFSWNSGDSRSRHSAILQIVQYCKSIPNIQKLSLIEQLQTDLNVILPPKPNDGFNALNWNQIRELHRNNIEIGGHTCSHPILSRIETSKYEHEILYCKIKIEEQLNSKISSFCFPNGTKADFNDEIKRFVKQSGYTNCTAAYYAHPAFQDNFEIKRNSASDDMFQFKKVVYGYEHLSKLLSA